MESGSRDLTRDVEQETGGRKDQVCEDSENPVSNAKGKWTEEQRLLIISECVDAQVSPGVLARRWGCSASTIRQWVRRAGKELPKKYKQVQLKNKVGFDVDKTITTSRVRKRVNEDEDDLILNRVRKFLKESRNDPEIIEPDMEKERGRWGIGPFQAPYSAFHMTVGYAHYCSPFVSFLKDYKFVVTCSDDKTVAVYSHSNIFPNLSVAQVNHASQDISVPGHLSYRLEGHTGVEDYCGGVLCVSLCDDTVVTGGVDSSVRVWLLGATEYTLLRVLLGHTDWVRDVTQDQDRVYSGDESGFLLVWDKELIKDSSEDHSEEEILVRANGGPCEGTYMCHPVILAVRPRGK